MIPPGLTFKGNSPSLPDSQCGMCVSGGGARGVHQNTSSQGGAGRARPQPQRGGSLQTGLTSPCRPHLLGEGASQGGDVGFPGALGASLAEGRREG